MSFGFGLDYALGKAWVEDVVIPARESAAVFREGDAKMGTTKVVRQGDRLPPLQALAFTADERVDLTAFESISFRMWLGETVIEGTATGNADGELEYEWQANDTAIAGTYEAVFIATDGAGRTQTFPSGENLRVIVKAAAPEPT